ncbi:hypothetical protein TDB9533_04653 [Thalassocella blandensis]|nr:hypothetical protein TDB9533_04653 [Thalassocella blandensis]
MADIYLCGHGSWDTIGTNDPLVVLPAKTSISFYTPVGRYLDPGNAYATMTGDTTGGGFVLPVDHEVKEYKMCTNLTLKPLVPGTDTTHIAVFDRAQNLGKQIHRVNRVTRLRELLPLLKGNHLHWMACRPRLNDSSVDEGGFNDDYIPQFGMLGGIPDHLRNR